MEPKTVPLNMCGFLIDPFHSSSSVPVNGRASSVFSDIMSRASAASVCGSLLPVAMVTLPSLTSQAHQMRYPGFAGKDVYSAERLVRVAYQFFARKIHAAI